MPLTAIPPQLTAIVLSTSPEDIDPVLGPAHGREIAVDVVAEMFPTVVWCPGPVGPVLPLMVYSVGPSDDEDVGSAWSPRTNCRHTWAESQPEIQQYYTSR